jgi:arylsulfatase A-like enzyme
MVRGDAEPAALDKYLTFQLADEACGFIRKEKANPFFLYLAFNAPHAPMEAPPEYLKQTKQIKSPKRAIYAAMVLALDDAVGQVLDGIRRAGLEENTLIVFLSDNGGATIPGSDENGASNAPLRGSKAQLLEGGIRVPFFVSWPGKISAGQVIDTPIISLDLFPTFSALAGAGVQSNCDGLDLSELLRGEVNRLPPRDLFWRFYDTQSAVRSGDLKWVRMAPDNSLYNLSEDIAESNNLMDRSGSEAERLNALWQSWDRKNIRQILP